MGYWTDTITGEKYPIKDVHWTFPAGKSITGYEISPIKVKDKETLIMLLIGLGVLLFLFGGKK